MLNEWVADMLPSLTPGNQIKEEGEARNAAAQELKRLREKDQLGFRALDAERQSAIEKLKRDVQTCNADRNAMESKLVTALNQQQECSAQVSFHLCKCLIL